MAEAITSGDTRPIQAFVAHRAAVVEIERHPATARAHHRANHLANHAGTVQERSEHAIAVAEIYRAAYTTVNG
ncbi:hypothetical protein GCM10009759_65760 [Kitasatospora saccharophila]|uniref:Uncharacterized protein n=2 Tax=Kitasatospora saccharophila TaxID=407973 RepID=A0ABP5JIG6_9ACTN